MGLTTTGGLLILALVFPACNSSKEKSKGEPTGVRGSGVLHLHCTWTEPYCGGAEPDPSDYPRPQPWGGRMFIRSARPDSSGKSALNDLRIPIFDSIDMNGEGHGYLALPSGAYLLLDRDRKDDRKARQLSKDHAKPVMYTEPIDTACLRRWLQGPFAVFAITSGDTLHLEYPMYGQCPWYATPCVRYNGPLPP
jgi:hypothetical protein